LGPEPEKNQAESADPGLAARLKLAVFIDIDNVSNDVAIRSAFESLAPRWNSICRRAYCSGLGTHLPLFRDLGISPIEVFRNTPGKDATDIALVIDVMSELSLGRTEAFCVVSGDGDFSRLALTIRESGLPVLVFGPESTPDSLRSASTEFHLLPSKPVQEGASSGPRGKAAPTLPATKSTTTRRDQAELIQLVLELAASTGKTTLGAINQAGCRRDEGFCSKQYGNQRLITTLRGLGLFDVYPVRNSRGVVQDYEVRPKAAVCASPAERSYGEVLSAVCPVPSTMAVKSSPSATPAEIS
jgi:hypothetical protein